MTDQTTTQVSNERLALLYNISQTFNSSLDLDQVLNSVIDEINNATQAERGFLIMRAEDGTLEFRAARGVNHTTIDDPELQISRGVIEQVLQEGKPVLSHDAQMDSRFSGMQSVAFLGLSSVMCAPLKVRDDILGAVYVENRIQAGIFTEDDLDLLHSIASSAAIAIENARLYQVAVEKGRMERELQVARRVQQSFIPSEVCEPYGWEMASYLRPAREVGGDFYDCFYLENSQRLGLVLGDVCDKGIGAAMFMALFRSLIRAYAEMSYSIRWGDLLPEKSSQAGSEGGVQKPHAAIDPGAVALKNAVVQTSNYIATVHGDTNMFCTLFFGVLDPETGVLIYINGGHEPPVLINNQKIKARLRPTGPALGLFPDMEFNIEQIELDPGDSLLVFTDGATDALNPAGDLFTEERLLSKACLPADTLRDSLDIITTSLQEHIGDRAQFDDITLLALRRGLEKL